MTASVNRGLTGSGRQVPVLAGVDEAVAVAAAAAAAGPTVIAPSAAAPAPASPVFRRNARLLDPLAGSADGFS
jgi:hypothetical protein